MSIFSLWTKAGETILFIEKYFGLGRKYGTSFEENMNWLYYLQPEWFLESSLTFVCLSVSSVN